MKKLIALAMMVVCVAGLSLGCTPKEKPKTPATDAVATTPADGAATTPTTDTAAP